MGLVSRRLWTGQIISTTTINNQISVSPTTTTNYYVRAEEDIVHPVIVLE